MSLYGEERRSTWRPLLRETPSLKSSGFLQPAGGFFLFRRRAPAKTRAPKTELVVAWVRWTQTQAGCDVPVVFSIYDISLPLVFHGPRFGNPEVENCFTESCTPHRPPVPSSSVFCGAVHASDLKNRRSYDPLVFHNLFSFSSPL